MIAPNISMKLEGRHYEAFRAFALRTEAKTSTENLKRLIETLPEFKSLLNIHETVSSSVTCESKTTHVDTDCQENSGKVQEAV